MDELDLTGAEAKATYEEAMRHFQMIDKYGGRNV